MAIISHGREGHLSEGSHILTANALYIPSEDVIRYFSNKSCPNLKGKPKIFLFQFCRGGDIDQGMRDQLIPIVRRKTVTGVSPDHQVQSSQIQLQRSFEAMFHTGNQVRARGSSRPYVRYLQRKHVFNTLVICCSELMKK